LQKLKIQVNLACLSINISKLNRKEFLKELRQFGIDNTVPNISDVNVKLLVDLIKISKTKKMLEI
jgi:predicted O-methyltransferase YrrM